MNHPDMNPEESPFRMFEGIFRRFAEDATKAIQDWEVGQREALDRFGQRIDAIARQELAEQEKRGK
jgi:hypothetical protein